MRAHYKILNINLLTCLVPVFVELQSFIHKKNEGRVNASIRTLICVSFTCSQFLVSDHRVKMPINASEGNVTGKGRVHLRIVMRIYM